jgi:hypothetical protein
MAELKPGAPSLVVLRKSARSAAPGGADYQVGDGVAEPRWRHPVLAAAWRLSPSGSVWREGVQQGIELAVDIPTWICVVWPHEENAGSKR